MNNNQNTPTLLNIISLEDSEIDFEIISEKLINSGYLFNIQRVDKENEFISLIRNNNYDLILADYNLPGFDAFEALKLCNLYCPMVPFICISGSIGEILAIELLKNGAVDYVLKDRLERLPFAVKRAIEEKNVKNARILAEEELKKKETNYRTLTENIPDIISRLDKDLKHIYVNPAIEKTSGLTPSSYIGKTNEELGMPVEKVVIWNEYMNRAFQTAKQQTFEFDFQTPEGIRYFSSLIVPELDEAGKVNSILIVARDISENKLAEIALKESEERLRDIMFNTMDWVWEVDKNGRYTYSSQRDLDLFGVSQDEVIGKTPFDFMPEEEAKRIAEIFLEIAANKAPIIDLENWNIGKDGNLICLLTNGVPILGSQGELLGYRGVDKNITDRKKSEFELIKAKEKAEESDRLKSSFLSNMSHEIRTPLNAIIGFSELLFDPFFDPQQQIKFVDSIKTSGKNLLRIISDIMDFSRIETGQISFRKEKFSADQLIRKVGNEQSHLIKERGLELRINSQEQDILMIGDEGRITQILDNFVGNAIKFSEKGFIEIGFNYTKHSVDFYVKDTGIGIQKEFHEQIFERFRQLESAYTRKYGGNGLGLAISKQLAELMGGKVSVESEPGIGSTFYLTVPI